MSSATVPSAGPGLTFRLACWVLGLIAFLQLLVAGIALALRVEKAREVRVEERVVVKEVEVPVAPKPATGASGPVVAIPPLPAVPAAAPLPPARPLDAPPITDPVIERLVNEAREARVAEDMGTAIPKLQTALDRDPNEPNALYEMAMAYETMAGADVSLAGKAAEYYQKVFELGTSGAGALYPLAAQKLRDGIAQPTDMRGKLSLGRVRIFKDESYDGGQRVVLTVPVSAAPGAEPAPDDFQVQVHFFDENRQGEVVPALQEVNLATARTVRWVSGDIDWLGGEELMRLEYILPDLSPADARLFGLRTYYGQVVELYYKNELIDRQAWPRHLATRLEGQLQPAGMDPLFQDQDMFDGSVLPMLPDELPTGELPPFDER